MKNNNTNNFNDLINEIKSDFGKDNIFLFDEESKLEKIPSGNVNLDKILGGGFPKGRIVEIFGNESCGKTTVAMQAIVECQKNNGKCVYFDLERTLSKKYCEQVGINIEQLLIITPENGEKMFSIMETLISSGLIDLIVIDSVAAIVPKAEYDGEFEDQTIGLAARIMSKGLRNIQPLIDKYKTCVIFINQIREKIGITFGNNETTTGGRALRFYASIRLELRRNELIKNGENCVGIKINAKTVKNKVIAPMMKTSFNIFFEKGYDHTLDTLEFAIEKNIIEKKGSWFYFNEQKIAQGKDSTREYLLNNPEIFNQIEKQTIEVN